MIYAGDANVIDALDNKEEVLANGYNDSSTKYTQIKFEYEFDFSILDWTLKDVAPFNGVGGINFTVNGYNSDIKFVLDEWYKENLLDYTEYIDNDSGFCNDRSIASSWDDGTEEVLESWTNYGALNRLWLDPQAPIFDCPSSEDLYTLKSSSKGNKLLTYPVGLITADEVVYAGSGSKTDTNINYYLYTGYDYWTISPYKKTLSWGYNNYYVFKIGKNGNLDTNLTDSTDDSPAVRPVINLSPTATLTGSGTIESPYEIIGL